MAPVPAAVYATLVMSDTYLPGAAVLAHSLRDHGAKAKLVAMVTMDTLSASTISELKDLYDEVIPVSHIVNKSPANLYLMNRPDLISTFTKIELWKQTQYSRIVYIDADVVAIRAPNELLTLETEFAAVPDIGWPDCFNSGVMVLNPNMGDYYSLLALAQRGISFDGADQGLLNMHFREWERLSFTYNCTPSGNYQYVPAYRHFQSSISLVHFIGPDKPWTLGRYSKQSSGVYEELLGRWWAVYDKHYRPKTAVFSGQSKAMPTVQNFVKGEAYVPSYGYSSQFPTVETQPPPQESQSYQQAPAPVEEPLGEQSGVVESIQQGESEPTPTVEQRRFSAPTVDWDAARAPPPPNSKPEAANFPSQVYNMSSDKKLFEAPAEYPEPPKDMYYQVPPKAEKTEKLAPIFPWETHAPKPTRVFPDEKKPAPPPEPEPVPEPEPETVNFSSPTDESVVTDQNPITPTISHESDPWSTYSRVNAWDEMPEITRYVQAVQTSRRGKVQVLHGGASSQESEALLSPTREERRSSFKLTDFPSEVERPSLPVTPAPIRKPSFWGEERDEQGEFPAAAGVPQQEDWVSKALVDLLSSLPHASNLTWRCQYCGKQNPVARLEELQRRQSELLEKVPQAVPDPPHRKMPESASKEAAEAADDKATSPPERPSFRQPNFSSSSETDGSKDKSPAAVRTRA